MKKSLWVISLLIISQYGSAQFIEKYGLNIGATYANQLWNYKIMHLDNPAKKYKAGLSAFLWFEKQISNKLNLRSEFGYLQKGFKNDFELIAVDGSTMGAKNKNVILHDAALNIGIKVSPFKLQYSPYMLLGISGDYMFSYKDIEITETASGYKSNLYQSQIEQFKRCNLGGFLGIGLEFNETCYVEFHYNPSLTNSYNSEGLRIKDNCWGLKLGVNFRKLFMK